MNKNNRPNLRTILLKGVITLLPACACASPALAVEPLPSEFEQRSLWVKQHFSRKDHAPFSFVCDDRRNAEGLRGWTFKKSAPGQAPADKLTPGAVAQNVTYTDPKTGLLVRAEWLEFRHHPVVE